MGKKFLSNSNVVDLAKKYKIGKHYKDEINDYRHDGLAWYEKVNITIEVVACHVNPLETKLAISEYLDYYLTPEYIYFELLFDSYNSDNDNWTDFACYPKTDNGEYCTRLPNDCGFISGFDWLLDFSTVFNDMTIKPKDNSEHSACINMKNKDFVDYIENKGFEVVVSK